MAKKNKSNKRNKNNIPYHSGHRDELAEARRVDKEFRTLLAWVAADENVDRLEKVWQTRGSAPTPEHYKALAYALAWNDNTPERIIAAIGDEIASGQIDDDEELLSLVAHQAVKSRIRKTSQHLVQIMLVGAGEGTEAWAYTVGLRDRGLPELAILGGLRPDQVASILNTLTERLIAGETFAPDENISGVIAEPYSVQLGPVMYEEADGYPLTFANKRSSTEPWRAVRWPDADGNFHTALDELVTH
jgi:hypothetical protein